MSYQVAMQIVHFIQPFINILPGALHAFSHVNTNVSQVHAPLREKFNTPRDAATSLMGD